ncbi:MAG: hypothetical protein OXO54_04515 [Chloroflexota bacterium]|nr:hypothetical protein [Chloroflexota bacterium]MDE2897566.1 hypothetical protein [Chloroflexota bacterium]
MKEPNRLQASAFRSSHLSRRRLAALLAASAGAVATLSACGEPEKRKPGGYDFPGAEKDGTGRFKSSQTL